MWYATSTLKMCMKYTKAASVYRPFEVAYPQWVQKKSLSEQHSLQNNSNAPFN